MATLNPDLTITIAPIKDIHTEGIYTFYLGGRLTEYGFYEQVAFRVQVTYCQAIIDVSNLVLPAIWNVWYDSELYYDITPFQPYVAQYPDCSHPLSFNAFMESPAFSGNFINLPIEISFNSNVFTISKCDPLGQISYVDG
jgi:hypothetical protein